MEQVCLPETNVMGYGGIGKAKERMKEWSKETQCYVLCKDQR